MGVFDSIKNRLGFGDDGYDEWDEEEFEDEGTSLNVRPRSERPDDFDEDETYSPWGPQPSVARSALRPVTRPGYAGYREAEDADPAPVPGRQSRGVITGRGPVIGGPGPVAQHNAQVGVHVVEPRSFTDAEAMGDRFKRGQIVIMSMGDTRPELAKRLLDFASGITFALDGSIQKVTDKVFMLTPRNVQMSDSDKRRLREVGFFRDDE